MNHQAAIIRTAKKTGIDLSTATKGDYLRLSLAVRSLHEIVSDGARAGLARANSFVRLYVVPATVRDDNLGVCRSGKCGSYQVLVDGTEVCHRCNCQGANLISKAEQPNESCPARDPETGKPYWTNEGKGEWTVLNG